MANILTIPTQIERALKVSAIAGLPGKGTNSKLLEEAKSIQMKTVANSESVVFRPQKRPREDSVSSVSKTQDDTHPDASSRPLGKNNRTKTHRPRSKKKRSSSPQGSKYKEIARRFISFLDKHSELVPSESNPLAVFFLSSLNHFRESFETWLMFGIEYWLEVRFVIYMLPNYIPLIPSFILFRRRLVFLVMLL